MRDDSFMARAMRGEVDDLHKAIDDAIDVWHDGQSALELHDYLGMGWESYALWARVPRTLVFLVLARVLLGREDSAKKLAEISAWLSVDNSGTSAAQRAYAQQADAQGFTQWSDAQVLVFARDGTALPQAIFIA